MKICFATNNQHKLEELRQLLGNSIELVGLSDIGCNEELAEDQDTLEGNSLQKAQYVFDHYHVNCFADDTGLEVESLNGEPGVYSARYAGPQRNNNDNINLLLTKLKQEKNRSAQFRTIITLIIEGNVHTFEGIVKGEITLSASGQKGFGYDPVFKPDGYETTFAEMTMEEKNKISHRGRATQKLVHFLKANH